MNFNHCRSIEILLQMRFGAERGGFMEELAFMLGLEGGVRLLVVDVEGRMFQND